MDYKEKYEALVGGIKGWLDKYVGDWQRGVFNLPFDKTGEIAKDIIKLVPELRESEDEMMRKSLIEYLKTKDHECDHWIAYLEKQKEQKPAEWTDADENILERIINRQKFVIPVPGAGESPFLASFEHSEDAEAINWLKRRVASRPQQEQAWSEEDEKTRKEIVDFIGRMVEKGNMKIGDRINSSSWFKFLDNIRPQPKMEWSDDDEKNWGQIFACIKDDALKEWLEKQKAKIIADIKNDQTTEGQHNDQTIAWKKYEDGHRFDSDTVVIGLNRSEPRLVRCAVSACYGIAVKDLLKLPFCL